MSGIEELGLGSQPDNKLAAGIKNTETENTDESKVAELLSRVIEKMTQLIISHNETAFIYPDRPKSCPDWEEVLEAMDEIGDIGQLDPKYKLSASEKDGAQRAYSMLFSMQIMLGRMKGSFGFSESTMNGAILTERDKLRECVRQNKEKSDQFAQFINSKVIQFYSEHMVNAIRRNAPRLPGGLDADNVDITEYL